MRRSPQWILDLHVRNLTEMRQLSLGVSCREVGRIVHMVPCCLASKFHVCFKKTCTNSKLLVRASIPTLVATFRVARLTLQTRKLWLVGRLVSRPVARYLWPARMWWVNMNVRHMPWILISWAIHGVCAFSEDKNRYYTWSGLCTAGNCAGMYSVHGRVTVVNMYEYQRSSSRADCTFWCKIREPNAEVPFTKETEKARLPTDSCLFNSKLAWTLRQLHLDLSRVSKRSPRLVYSHSMVLKKRLFSLSSSRVSGLQLGPKSWSPRRATSQSSRKFALLVALAHCPCFAHCCHDPLIVRSAPSLSTVPWFHSACVPSRCSRSTLTTVCFCLFSVPVSPSLHRVSVYIPRPLCTYRVCSPVTRCITGFVSLHPEVECGIHGQ